MEDFISDGMGYTSEKGRYITGEDHGNFEVVYRQGSGFAVIVVNMDDGSETYCPSCKYLIRTRQGCRYNRWLSVLFCNMDATEKDTFRGSRHLIQPSAEKPPADESMKPEQVEIV